MPELVPNGETAPAEREFIAYEDNTFGFRISRNQAADEGIRLKLLDFSDAELISELLDGYGYRQVPLGFEDFDDQLFG